MSGAGPSVPPADESASRGRIRACLMGILRVHHGGNPDGWDPATVPTLQRSVQWLCMHRPHSNVPLPVQPSSADTALLRAFRACQQDVPAESRVSAAGVEAFLADAAAVDPASPEWTGRYLIAPGGSLGGCKTLCYPASRALSYRPVLAGRHAPKRGRAGADDLPMLSIGRVSAMRLVAIAIALMKEPTEARLDELLAPQMDASHLIKAVGVQFAPYYAAEDVPARPPAPAQTAGRPVVLADGSWKPAPASVAGAAINRVLFPCVMEPHGFNLAREGCDLRWVQQGCSHLPDDAAAGRWHACCSGGEGRLPGGAGSYGHRPPLCLPFYFIHV